MSNRLPRLGSSHHRLDLGKIRLLFSCVGVLLIVATSLPQKLKGGPPPPPASVIPTAATVEIVLLIAPGINDEGSQWEIAYEFRITNEAALWDAHKQEKTAGAEGRVGDLIEKGDVKKTLRSPENHKFPFQIPFSPEIQERLKNQPTDSVRIPTGAIPPETNKLSQQREIRSQVFMFYSVINIYDARLKKNILIPVPQSWDFANYPDARFGFTIEINNDGSYRWKTSPPANSRSPVLEIRKP